MFQNIANLARGYTKEEEMFVALNSNLAEAYWSLTPRSVFTPTAYGILCYAQLRGGVACIPENKASIT